MRCGPEPGAGARNIPARSVASLSPCAHHYVQPHPTFGQSLVSWFVARLHFNLSVGWQIYLGWHSAY